MNTKSFLALIGTVALLIPASLTAQTTNRPASSMDSELQAIVQGIQAKLKAGKSSESDLAPDIASFDKLISKHEREKSDATAQIIYM